MADLRPRAADSPGRIVSLYVTTPDGATAERLGRALVTERLAACANVLPAVVSIYEWEHTLQREAEALLLCKTRAALVERASARLVELHPYDLPCVLVLPVVGGHGPYLDWIELHTDGTPGR